MTAASELDLAAAATLTPATVMATLGSDASGLSSTEAARRLSEHGPNAIQSHGVSPFRVLARQLRSYLLLLLLAAALVSAFVGDYTEAGIIAAILALSVGLGFLNEYRSERPSRRCTLRSAI